MERHSNLDTSITENAVRLESAEEKILQSATANQQLKAEIAALESRLRMVGCVSAEDTEELCSIREKMRQLSAV